MWVRSVTRRFPLLRRACGLLGCCRSLRRSAGNKEIMWWRSGRRHGRWQLIFEVPSNKTCWMTKRQQSSPINHLMQVYFNLLITNWVWFRKHDGWTVLVREFTRVVSAFGLVQGSWRGSDLLTDVTGSARYQVRASAVYYSWFHLLVAVTSNLKYGRTTRLIMSLTWSHKECRFQPELI